MPHLQLSMVSEGIADQIRTFQFTSLGGTIGRSKDCDWTLHDVDRYISNKHIVISYLDNQFILTDQSSNGVFINDASSPLGKGNHHTLSLSDRITLGKFCLAVETMDCSSISPSYTTPASTFDTLNSNPASGDGGLLDLVSGSGDNNAKGAVSANVGQSIGESAAHRTPTPSNENLGLQDILSSSTTPSFDTQQSIGDFDSGFGIGSSAPSNDNEAFNSDPFGLGKENNEASPFANSAISDNPQSNNSASANPFSQAPQSYETPDNMQSSNVIPEDWDLSDSSTEDSSDSSGLNAPQVDFSSNDFVPNDIVQNDMSNTPQARPQGDEGTRPSVAADARSTPNVASPDLFSRAASEITEPDTPVLNPAPNPAQRPQATSTSSDDAFFQVLYEKLGLPKEYIDTVDKTQFADDIVNVLMTSTQGIMALLAGRSVFKQESRLSMTMIKPQSNNPIKFSIDPSDTLEMLLVKKKPGYMSAQDSYAEALNDIQLHQMAFLSGLQATLAGVVGEMSPDEIEQQAKDSGQSFIGLKMNNLRWQLFKDKQDILGKQVNENLNELLSKYFSEAYEAQINSIKNR